MVEETKRKKGVAVWVYGVLGAGVSGGVMGVCLWPFNWHFLAWVGMVAVLMALPKVKAEGAMLMGLVFALVYFRISLNCLFVLAGPIGVVAVVVLGE